MSKKAKASKSRTDAGSTLTIRAESYPLDEVRLYTTREELGGEACLTFELFADSRKNPAGFAINSITVRGVSRLRDLE